MNVQHLDRLAILSALMELSILEKPVTMGTLSGLMDVTQAVSKTLSMNAQLRARLVI
jgi:hypothetical protein